MRRFYDLDLVRDHNEAFALSWTAMHPINEASPLYGQSTESLAAVAGELVVSLAGIDEHSAQTVHARRSYIPDDLRWNHKFADVLETTPEGQRAIPITRHMVSKS